MTQIKTINSEAGIEDNIIKKFKTERKMDQTAFYLDEGADYYYNYYDPNTEEPAKQRYDYSKIIQMLQNVLAEHKAAKATVISLGCGACKTDKVILEGLQEAGYDVPLFGIDASMAMLHKADEVLKDVTFEKHLICANFGAPNFRKKLAKITKEYDLKIYLFFGSTIGNLNQGDIADILYNTLRKEDYLLLDVSGFKAITPNIHIKLFKRYHGYLDNSDYMNFLLRPLKALGVPEDCGELTLTKEIDPPTQAHVFKFGFEITSEDTVRLNIDDEVVSLSTKEHIALLIIMIYDLRKLVKFLEKRGFEFKEQILGEFDKQLLFQRR